MDFRDGRDSPMRQRKLIGSNIDETDLRRGKTIILRTTLAPLTLPSTTAAFDRLVSHPLAPGLQCCKRPWWKPASSRLFLRRISKHDSTWSRMIIATSHRPLIWRPSGRAVELESIRPSRRLEAKGGLC